MNITKIVFFTNLLLALVYSGFAFGKRPDAKYAFRLKAAALLFLILAMLSGGMLWREKRSVRVLESVIAIPEVSGVTAFPSRKELEAVSAAMRVFAEAAERAGLRFTFSTAEDFRQLERKIRQNPVTASYWAITTPLMTGEIREFYRRESNLNGWEIAADNGNILGLERDGYRLMIQYQKTWYPDKREIFYRLSKK